MSRSLTRFGLSVPFVLGVMVVAFGLGTFLGGKFLVPPGQGLAAPAEAMGYGLLLALIAMAVAIFAAVKMPMKTLGLFALASAIVAALLVTWITLELMKTSAEVDAYYEYMGTQNAATLPVPPPCPLPEDGTTTDESIPCHDD